ncbi:MAG: response regulator [Methanomassiliicoccales archaeon]|nr:response regulator [Methanomassiliicoccales archaeon]
MSTKGRVLVLDDDPPVLEILGDVLSYLDYEAVLTRSGEETINAFRKQSLTGKPFDLVILDLTVKGGLGGRDVIGMLMIIDPDVRALVSSGLANDPVVENYRAYGFCGLVPKPFTVEELSESLEKAMRKD